MSGEKTPPRSENEILSRDPVHGVNASQGEVDPAQPDPSSHEAILQEWPEAVPVACKTTSSNCAIKAIGIWERF